MGSERGGSLLQAGQIMVAPTDQLLATCTDTWQGLLTPAERDRAAAFRRLSDQRDYVAAHLLVRLCAASAINVPPATLSLLQRCSVCRGPHGRPSLMGLAEVHVSLAHTAGWVAAAIAGEPVGVDIEDASCRALDPALLDVVLTPMERSVVESADSPALTFRRFWVRKEALLKVGYATLDTLRDLDLSRLPLPDCPGDESPDLQYGELYVREWSDRSAVVVGAAASAQRLRLVPWPGDVDPILWGLARRGVRRRVARVSRQSP